MPTTATDPVPLPVPEWQGHTVPYGTKKGEALGNMDPKWIQMHAELFEPNESPEQQSFRLALNEAVKSLNLQGVEDDVPF